MDNWKEYKIGDLCEVGRGSSPRPILDTRYFKDGTIPWIKIADATASGKYIYKTKEHVNEFGASYSRYLDENSLIIAASGVSLGQIKFLGVKGCIHDGWLYISKYNENINKEYLYYFLIHYAENFHNFSYGAAIQNINTDILKNTVINLPPVNIQNHITSILSSYDELIEVNNQRIKLLEDTAQQLYKEWFIRMRFPNYKKTKFEKGIPKSWKVESLAKHISIVRGKSYTSEEIDDSKGDHPFINLKNMKRGGGFRLDGTKFFTGKFKKEQIVVPGDIVMAVTDMTQDRLIVGRVARVPLTEFKEYVISLDISKIVSLSLPNDYIYSALRFNYYGESLAEFANGTNVLHLNPELLKKESILIPDEHLINDFVLMVKPMYELMDVLAIQIEQLRQIRDRLLPRLISGKLQVKEKKELKKTQLVK